MNTLIRTTRTGHRGFSAAELLVVIGLVAVLLAIMIPVVQRARSNVLRTQCAANLAQIGLAFQVYASENDGYVPRYGLYAGERPQDWPIWIVALARVLGAPKGFGWDDIPRVRSLQCPSHPTDHIPSGYVLNAFAFESAPAWDPSPPVRCAKIRNASAVVWIVEAADRFGLSVYGPFDAIFFEPYHVIRHPQMIVDRVKFDRHAGRSSNVLYADGHVATVRAGSIGLANFDDGIRQR
jgi:prepilin-type processing-associated H-X9-DG protein/prepilin-type N-terminal cleavage/methylation domain-containing protein